MAADSNPFSAADSALGYFYQCRYALLEALRRYRACEDYSVSIEKLDDVDFDTGHHLELIQTKHHFRSEGSLSDASTDVWKTLRVWCEGVQRGAYPQNSVFYLVTTATASTDSAASCLLTRGRDPARAYEILHAVAVKSQSRENAPAYQAFLASSSNSRHILESMTVLDSSAAISDLPKLLRAEIRPAVYQRHMDAFLGDLEGWWYTRVIQQLAGTIAGPIESEEVEDRIDRLRGEFSDENLPIDDAIRDAEIDEAIDASSYLDEQFVKQLRLINAQNPRIFIAIREYFRAFEQRSKWARVDLLHVGELGKYERRLIDEWKVLFARMREELGPAATAERKVELARALYNWAEAHAGIPIRPKCDEPFVTRGSFHMLANDLRVGWHPDFLEILERTIEEAESGS